MRPAGVWLLVSACINLAKRLSSGEMSIAADNPIRVSLDVTEHWRIQGGIWRYVTSLLRAFTRILSPDNVRAVSFDRLPPDRIEQLRATGAQLVLDGLHSYIHRPHMAFGRHAGFARDHLRLTPSFPLRGIRAHLARKAMGAGDIYHFPWQPLFHDRHTPCVGTIHDLTPILLPECHGGSCDAFSGQLQNLRATCARIIAISKSTRNDLLSSQGFDPAQIVVVYPGVDTDRFTPRPTTEPEALTRHGLVHNGYFLYVGTLEPRKNLNTLLDAYLMARDEHAMNLPLVLVGSIAWGMEDFARRLETADVSRSVHHLGHVPDDDLPAIYRGARGLVYVSLYEGFGIPPLEAMSCGTPVIASNTSSLPEVVGETGLLVDPGNAEEIANAIARVHSDEESAMRMRKEGPIRARQFTWEATARNTVAVYQEAIEASSLHST